MTNARIETVVSNNKNAYALERARAHGILAKCISPKDYPSRAAFNEALYDYLTGCGLDLDCTGRLSCRCTGTGDCQVQKPDD